jgi:predicted  nucleic acid-binding Zn-ribbon protein
MKENMELINQIAELRKEVTTLNSRLRNQDSKLAQIQAGGSESPTRAQQDIAATIS